MTEQEAMEMLDSFYEMDEMYSAAQIAIKALEEIQQYRAMEKRLEAIYGDCPGLLETVVEHLERHDGIGTDKPAFKARLLTDDNVDKWDSYKEIGTPEECRAAVEKQKEMIAYCDENDCSDCPYHNGHWKENKCMNDFIADDIVKGCGTYGEN